MNPLYDDGARARAAKQARGRSLAALGFLLLGVAGLAAALLMRNRIAGIASLALGSSLAWFYYDLFAAPCVRYTRFLREMAKGLSRETTGAILSIADAPRVVDGIAVRDIMLETAVCPGSRDEARRLFYWDDRLPGPEFLTGERVAISAYDRHIIGYTRLTQN